MKKTISLLLALVLVMGLLSACGKAAEPQPTETPATPVPAVAAMEPSPAPTPVTPDFDPADLHPMLWKVTDPDGHTLYLFGTIHVGDGRSAAVLEKVSPILQDCDALAVEFDLVAYEQDLNAVMADYQQFVYVDGSSVRDHISEELYDRCADLLGQIGAYSPMLDYYNLGMWSQLLEQAALLTCSNLDPEMGMDRLLISQAYENEIPVLSIESASFQMSLLNSFSDELYLLQMEAVLDNLGSYGESIDRLYTAWLSGNYDDILDVLNEEDDSAGYTEEQLTLVEDYNRALLDDRNLGMAEVALGYLASGDTVFLAVGTAHMVDDMGLAQLLRDAGCTVERVDY